MLSRERSQTSVTDRAMSHSAAQNPEVAGSNPAPATKKVQVRGMITELGGHALFFVVNQWSTNSAPRIAP
jgi:hypothetical protein